MSSRAQSNFEARLNENVSSTALFALAMVSYVLFIITASMGIWLANSCNDWSSAGSEKAVKAILITLLVLAIVLPIIYILYFYRRQIVEGVSSMRTSPAP